jgi:hypothetical protein
MLSAKCARRARGRSSSRYSTGALDGTRGKLRMCTIRWRARELPQNRTGDIGKVPPRWFRFLGFADHEQSGHYQSCPLFAELGTLDDVQKTTEPLDLCF